MRACSDIGNRIKLTSSVLEHGAEVVIGPNGRWKDAGDTNLCPDTSRSGANPGRSVADHPGRVWNARHAAESDDPPPPNRSVVRRRGRATRNHPAPAPMVTQTQHRARKNLKILL